MSTPKITIETDDDFAPSERLRDAIEVVAELCEAEAGSSPDDEVAGFVMELKLGPTRPVAGGRASGWRDGCWGYSISDGKMGCGWYQDGDDSCLWFGE